MAFARRFQSEDLPFSNVYDNIVATGVVLWRLRKTQLTFLMKTISAQCEEEEFWCAGGCEDESYMCDGYMDCDDGSDETSCAGENTMSMKE